MTKDLAKVLSYLNLESVPYLSKYRNNDSIFFMFSERYTVFYFLNSCPVSRIIFKVRSEVLNRRIVPSDPIIDLHFRIVNLIISNIKKFMPFSYIRPRSTGYYCRNMLMLEYLGLQSEHIGKFCNEFLEIGEYHSKNVLYKIDRWCIKQWRKRSL